MNIVQQLFESLKSLSANKMRSGLTMLGIMIGVAAVISMLAVGEGAQTSINNQIQSIGSNLIYVFSGNANADVKNPKPLTMGDANALSDPLQAPSIGKVAPVLSGRLEVTYGREATNTSVTGVTIDYFDVQSIKVTEGELFTESNLLSRSAVCLIGPDTAQKLFGRKVGVIDENIRIKGQVFKIVGVLETKGGSGFGSQDDRILVPLLTAQVRLFTRPNADQVDQILVEATTAEQVDAAGDEVTQILEIRHRSPVGADDFSLIKQSEILSAASSITGIFTIFLGGIGGISLLVGGIGIMNIMLVSVTERTREIGLRKAIGARRRDILLQFLMESATLSLLGGAAGIFLAWIITQIISIIAKNANANFTPIIGWNSILIATLFSLAIGLFFGIYPANRAASLAPVEALRSE
jgi:putative ABC transport system permease protein